MGGGGGGTPGLCKCIVIPNLWIRGITHKYVDTNAVKIGFPQFSKGYNLCLPNTRYTTLRLWLHNALTEGIKCGFSDNRIYVRIVGLVNVVKLIFLFNVKYDNLLKKILNKPRLRNQLRKSNCAFRK